MISLLLAAALTWQTGIWKDVQHVAQPPISFFIGSMAIPLAYDIEVFTIEGAAFRYVVKGPEGVHLKGVIINDAVDFRVVGDDKLIVRLGGKEKKLRIMSRTRLN